MINRRAYQLENHACKGHSLTFSHNTIPISLAARIMSVEGFRAFEEGGAGSGIKTEVSYHKFGFVDVTESDINDQSTGNRQSVSRLLDW